MENPGSVDRQVILDAALAELVDKGIDEFTDVVVADTPIRPDYVAQVVDIFVRGVSNNS